MIPTTFPMPYKLFFPDYCNFSTPSWTGHLVFAGILMRELQPEIFVELGTHLGNSYFSFCQSAKENNVPVRCFAVDSWKGEEQAGEYAEDVYRFVSEYNRKNFSEFSTLLRGMFDDFPANFEDGSIDLLHIDGYHSYEAAKHDFETWIDKVRPGGIVLFHDIAERQEGFGVWKFWEEICKKSDGHFGFTHSSGLGVWRKPGGTKPLCSLLNDLFSCKPETVEFISNAVMLAGRRSSADGSECRVANLYFAADKSAFSESAKVQQTIVVEKDRLCRTSFPFRSDLPCNALRLDLGIPGDRIRISGVYFLADGNQEIDLLNQNHLWDLNGIICTEQKTDLLEYSVFSGNPNLVFSIPTAVASGEIKIEFYCDCQSDGAAEIHQLTLQQQAKNTQELEADRDKWFKETQALVTDRNRLQNAVTDITADRDKWLKETQDLAADRDQWLKETQALEADRNRLQNDVTDIAADRDKWLQETQALEADRNRLQNDVTDITADRDKWFRETQALTGQYDKLQHDYDCLQKCNDQLAADCTRRNEQLQKNETEYLELVRSKQNTDAEKDRIQDNFNNLSQLYSASLAAAQDRERQLQQSLVLLVQKLKHSVSGWIRENHYSHTLCSALNQAGRESEIRLIDTTGLDGRSLQFAMHYNGLLIAYARHLLKRDNEEKSRTIALFIRIWRMQAKKILRQKKWYLLPDLILRRKVSSFHVKLLKNSDFFSPDFPDVTGDPAVHYLMFGWKEGRNPSPWFDTNYYLSSNPDVTGNPLVHYLCHGIFEGRSPLPLRNYSLAEYQLLESTPFFDRQWYLENYPDTAGKDPIADYLETGWQKKRNPSALFSTESYLAEHPDLDGFNPLAHYLCFGRFRENMAPAAFEQLLKECRLDFGYEPVPEQEVELPEDYNFKEEYRLLQESGLFDRQWYHQHYPEVSCHTDAIDHYLREGWQKGMDPSAFFSTNGYLQQNPDINGFNPLVHYLRHGIYEKRQLGNVRTLLAYDLASDIMRFSGFFNPEEYLQLYPDVAASGLDPLSHYLTDGWKEHRRPSSKFSGEDYWNCNADIRNVKMFPLLHYVLAGAGEGRKKTSCLKSDLSHALNWSQLRIEAVLDQPESEKETALDSVGLHLNLSNGTFPDALQQFCKKLSRVSCVEVTSSDELTEQVSADLNAIFGSCKWHVSTCSGDALSVFTQVFRQSKLKDCAAILHLSANISAKDAALVLPMLTPEKVLFRILNGSSRVIAAHLRKSVKQLDMEEIPEKLRFCSGEKSLRLPEPGGGIFWCSTDAADAICRNVEKYASHAGFNANTRWLLPAVTNSEKGNFTLLYSTSSLKEKSEYTLTRELLENGSALSDRSNKAERKLILVTHDTNGTGAPLLALHMAEEFFKLGYKLMIVALAKGRDFDKFRKFGSVYLLDINDRENIIKFAEQAKASDCCDVILNTTVSGRLAEYFKAAGMHVTTLVHEMDMTIRDMGLEYHAEILMKYSDRIIMPSTSVLRTWEAIGLNPPEKKLQICPQGNYHDPEKKFRKDTPENAATRKRIRAELGIADDVTLILACGAMEKRKGPDLFLDMAALIHEKHQNVHFLWLGDIFDHEAEARFKSPEFRSFCSCIGFRPNPDDYYEAADIYVLSSYRDPFPTVILQAMMHEIPAVMCRQSTGCVDLFEKVEVGIVEEYDAAAFAQEVEKLLDRDICAKTIAQVREAYQNYHSLSDYCRKLLSELGRPLQKITCVIPNYNYADYLEERVASVINQTYPIYELLILDDNSSDNSDAVIREMLPRLEKHFPGGVRYIRNETNCGVFRQWKRGFTEAKGDLIWIAEADDLCSPDLIENLAYGYAVMPSVGLAWANSVKIDEDGREIAVFDDYYKDLDLDYTKNCFRSGFLEVVNSLAVKNIIVNTSAVLMKRQYAASVPDELLAHRLVGDWLVYVHILSRSNMYYCAERLNQHREHTRSVTHQMNYDKLYHYFDENLTAQEYVSKKYPVALPVRQKAADYARLLLQVRANIMQDFPADKLAKIKERIEDLLVEKHTKKRICAFSTNDYGWGGSEISNIRIAEKLAESGEYEVLLCEPDFEKRPLLQELAANNESLFFCGRTTRYYHTDDQYYDMIRDFAPEFVYSSQGAAREAEIFMEKCIAENIPFTNMIPLFTPFQLEELERDKITERLAQKLEKSCMIFSDNENTGRLLKQILQEKMPPFACLRNCYGVDYDQPEDFPDKTPEGEYKLIFVGRITAFHKGLDTLLQVLSMPKWIERPLVFEFYGDGDYAGEIKRIADKTGAKIRLMGHTDHVAAANHSAMGVVFASRMEGTPITLVDAMLCHRMIIGTPVGGIPDFIDDGKTGFLAKGFTVPDVDEVLERAWEQREKWQEMGLAAGRKVRELVKRDPVSEYLPFFEKICAELDKQG